MKQRIVFAVLLVVAGCMAAVVGQRPTYYRAVAQSVPTPAILRFQISNVGTSQVLPLGGQSSCGIVFTSVGSGVTADIEGTIDGNIWSTLTQFTGGGSFAPPSVNTQYNATVFSAGASALTGIRLNVTGISTGPVAGTITCTNAQSGISGSVTAVVSPVPLPVSLPTCASTLPCVQVSSLPGPAATASPFGSILVTLTDASGIASSYSTQFIENGYSSGTTKVISGTASEKIRWNFFTSSNTSATGGSVTMSEGTGTNCGTNNAVFYTYELPTLSNGAFGEVLGNGTATVLQEKTAGDDVCLAVTSSMAVNIYSTYNVW